MCSLMALTNRQLQELRQSSVGPSGNRLAEAMRLVDIKQVALAEQTGLSQPYISDVARGRHTTITVDNARPLAEYFGCAIEDLFPARQAVAS